MILIFWVIYDNYDITKFDGINFTKKVIANQDIQNPTLACLHLLS